MSVGRTHPDYRPPTHHLYRVNTKRLIIPGNEEATRLEMLRVAEAAQEYRIKMARQDFGAFMEYCFYDEVSRRPFAQQWFHDEWSEAWDTHNRVIIIAPRDHGKTSQIVGRVLFELGRNPNLRIKIACAADGRAKERLFEVVQHIELNPRLQEVFPHLRQDKDAEWSKHKIVVKRTVPHRDASVEALGITATATGGRCDLLIADDVVDRRNALSFPKLRQQIKQAWKSDWTNLLEPESRIWYICTLWHKDDLSHELVTNKAYKTLFYAVPPDFGALWPGKWPEQELRKRHEEIGSIEFNRGFRNQAVDEDSSIIRDGWLAFSNLATDARFTDRLNELVFFTSYDTARATGEGNDFSACTVFAVDPEERRVFIVDAWHGKLTVKQQAEQVWKEYQKFLPFRILIEKVGQAVLDEWVLNDHPELASIIEVTTPKISKSQRLVAVTPLLERGDVIFSDHLNPDNGSWTPGREALVHELLDFPFGKNDDLVDSFSQGLSAARRYFLDEWATERSGADLDVRIGARGEDDGYLF